MAIDLNNPELLRRGEVAFSSAFHGIHNSDIELALSFGATIVDYSNEYDSSNPLGLSSLLAEIALLGHWHNDARLVREASTRGLTMSGNMSDQTAEDCGFMKEEKNLVVAKNRIIGSIIAEEDTEEDIELLQNTINELINRYDLSDRILKLNTVLKYLGRRNELATIRLFNQLVSGRVFLGASFLLDYSHVDLYTDESGTPFSVATDCFGVSPDKPNLDTIFLQVKRNGDHKQTKNGKDYAPHICPVIWSDFIDKAYISIIEKNPDHPDSIMYSGELLSMVRSAANHFKTHGHKRNGLMVSTGSEPLFLKYL